MLRHVPSALLGLLAVFAPIAPTVYAAGALVLADLITGVLAALKRNEKIRSDKLRKSVVKVLVYEAAIILGFVADAYLLGGVVPVVKIVAGLIGTVEIKSIFENLDAINGSPFLKSLVGKLAPENGSKNG